MIKNESIKELSYRLARQHLPGSFKDIEPITGKGEVNQVYLISTTQLTAVLRVNELIEYDRFRKERWCSETATEHGVPGPRVIATGKDKNCAYMLLEFIDGKNGKDIDSTLELWQTLG
ncbi:MAG: phosphotransferase, partial [Candidatus Saccharimonadales bacterium]